MAMPESGTIVQLPELMEESSPYRVHRKSLRVMGILESYDLGTGNAHISLDGAKLVVDTTLVRDLHFSRGSLYQFIGELLIQPDQMVLQARVGRNVDGLDVKLYEKALHLRRQFERSH